jgi:hypothetical protein
MKSYNNISSAKICPHILIIVKIGQQLQAIYSIKV